MLAVIRAHANWEYHINFPVIKSNERFFCSCIRDCLKDNIAIFHAARDFFKALFKCPGQLTIFISAERHVIISIANSNCALVCYPLKLLICQERVDINRPYMLLIHSLVIERILVLDLSHGVIDLFYQIDSVLVNSEKEIRRANLANRRTDITLTVGIHGHIGIHIAMVKPSDTNIR